MDVLIFILMIAGFALAIIIHEIAHGYAADRLGDPTAKLMGRLTLNPIPHIDILGSIIVPLIMYISPFHFIFGWAKPIRIDPYNLKNPKKDMALISLAGPFSNILFAIILSISLRVLLMVFPFSVPFGLFYFLIQINIVIAVFNLLPIGILDGGKILPGILPDRAAQTFEQFTNKTGLFMTALIILPIFGGNSIAILVISPIINFLLRILIPSFSTI